MQKFSISLYPTTLKKSIPYDVSIRNILSKLQKFSIELLVLPYYIIENMTSSVIFIKLFYKNKTICVKKTVWSVSKPFLVFLMIKGFLRSLLKAFFVLGKD